MQIDRVVFDANYLISIMLNGKLFEFSNLIISNNIDLCYLVKSYYLVTGDKPVQNLKHVGKIEIISPTKFNKLVKQNPTNL